MGEKTLLREICDGCAGCSLPPQRIEDLCSNPLEKYLYRHSSPSSVESYFMGRRHGIIIGKYQT